MPALVLFVPFARDLFRLSRLHKMDLVICSIDGVFSVLWFEALKIFGRTRVAHGALFEIFPQRKHSGLAARATHPLSDPSSLPATSQAKRA